MNIQSAVNEYIEETGFARTETRDGVDGVLFLDENQFIPWDDLGYSRLYGFFQKSVLQDVEAEYPAWSIHPLEGSERDGEPLWVLMDSDGYGHLIGDKQQVSELLPVLAAFLERGEHAEVVDDEVIGARYLSIAEACALANEYDYVGYPYHTPEEQDRLRRRLQRNIQRGNIPGVKQDPQGRYRIRATSFRGWLIQQKNQ